MHRPRVKVDNATTRDIWTPWDILQLRPEVDYVSGALLGCAEINLNENDSTKGYEGYDDQSETQHKNFAGSVANGVTIAPMMNGRSEKSGVEKIQRGTRSRTERRDSQHQHTRDMILDNHFQKYKNLLSISSLRATGKGNK